MRPRRSDTASTAIYEKSKPLRFAWLVDDVRQVDEVQAFSAVTTGRLADKSVFDPERTAVVEDALPYPIHVSKPMKATVRVLTFGDESVEVETESASDALVVVSEIYYPGWEAAVDDRPAKILQTAYILRGIAVPARRHHAALVFKSRTLLAELHQRRVPVVPCCGPFHVPTPGSTRRFLTT